MHGLQRGRYLVGIVGKIVDHRDPVRGAYDLQPPADAAELAQIRRGVCKRHAAGLRGAESGERVGNIVQPWNLEVYRDDFTAIARGHGKRDPGGRGDGPRRHEIGLGLGETVGHRLTRLQIRQQFDPVHFRWIIQ